MSGPGGEAAGVAARSPAKQALLDKWLAGRSAAAAAVVPRRADRGAVPLSFVQERQLFLELLDPLTAVNNLAVCLRITGPLDVAALERSADGLLARHEALRTSFDTYHGRPRARVTPAARADLGLVNLESPDGAGEDEAIRLARAQARTPFDLGQAPLLRVRTYRLAPEAHVMLVVVHHTVADGWSLGVFLRELFMSYEAECSGAALRLPPLSIQYADYAAWQREAADDPEFARQLRFWTRQLGGELPVLDLPIDRPRPPRQTFVGDTHRFLLSSESTARLRALSQRYDVTLFMTLTAAFQALLHRFSGQDDILIGTPISGRTRPEIEHLIGSFINTLVLRTDLSGDPTFRDVLSRVRSVALDAYAHQDLPFEMLVAHLKPQRDLSRTPIFQVAFIFQNTPLPILDIPGLSVGIIPVDTGAAPFDLTLSVTETAGKLDCAFIYNTDLFDPATIAGLARGFELLMNSAAEDPQRRVSALPVMNPADRDRLLVDLNATAASYPRERGVHELIEAQAARTPDAVAVACDGTRLSYAELDAWANGLAADLRAHGVGPGDTVGVCLDRSAGLVAGLLAVLKTGAAYVPIDPTLPPQRIDYMLRDAGARVQLVEASHRVVGNAVTLEVGRTPGTARTRARPDASKGGGEDVAYLVYTSGSTGRPKGVRVPHRALTNLLCSMRQHLGLGPDDTWLAVTSVSFDIAALELFVPLIAGGTVVVATPDMLSDWRRLQEGLEGEGVTVMQATPAMWRLMLEGGWRGQPGLVALSGGEPLTPDLAERLLARVGTLWNVYGPTETTIWSTAGRVKRGVPITVGRPIANTTLYILDAARQPVPAGVTGELYIGGDGVSLGYVNAPDLTAERFVRDPFAQPGAPSARLFRTGDLARYQPDGTVQLLGRSDHQVKINGFRIELGEIEAALGEHPEISAAVVVVRVGRTGEKSLVAYVVPAADAPPDPVSLREFLRETLPAYMVPPVFVPLAELPRTTAGKVDRAALPPADAATEDRPYVPPRTPLETRLADTYAAVLGIDRVGLHDNFFDLGGGSIQILEIIVRVQADGLSLAPELFFEHQTVSELAAFLTGGGGNA